MLRAGASLMLAAIVFVPAHHVTARMTWTQQANDTFTEGSDTALASHTPDLGSAWRKDNASGTIVVEHVQNTSFTTSISTEAPYANTTTLAGKQAVEATLKSPGAFIGLMICYSFSGGNAKGYVVRGNNFEGIVVEKWTGSGIARTGVTSNGTTYTTDDVLRVEYDPAGPSLTVLKNGSITLGPYTDSSWGSGSGDATVGVSGIWGYADGARLDNFAAYDDAGGGGSSFPAAIINTPIRGGGRHW